MNLTIEGVVDSINSGMDEAQRGIDSEVSKRKRLAKLNPQDVLDFINETIDELDYEVSNIYSYHYEESMDIYGVIQGMSYDDIIAHDECRLSYNGNHAKIVIRKKDYDLGLELRLSAEARIPCDDKEILVACGKIQEQVETCQVAMC